MSLKAAMTSLVAARAAPPAPTSAPAETHSEESSIQLQDVDFSMMYPNADEEQYGANPARGNVAKPHRTSLFMRESDRASKASERVQYTQVAPKFDHIRLVALTPWKVLMFWVAVLEYQSTHLLKLPSVAALMDERVKNAMVARFPEALQNARINHLTDVELQNFTIKMIQPRTKAQYVSKLTKAVRFNNDVVLKPSAEHFDLFYSALLEYRVIFTRMHDLLSRGIPEVVPECTMHPGGLIRLFLQKIPHNYGINVHNNMSTKKFDDIVQYINTFYKSVQRHHEFHLNTVELNDCFSGTAAAAFTKDKHTAGLHNIADDDGSAYVDRPAEIAHEEDLDDSPGDTPLAELFDDVEDTRHFEEMLAAMTNATGSKKDMACFSKLLHGTCTKTGCTYSHSEKLCNETRQSFIDMMRKVQRPAATGPGSRPPLSSSAPKPSFQRPKLNAVAEEEEDN